MFTKDIVNKIDDFLKKNLDIMFEFEFNGLLFLWGGAIKSIIMDLPIRDLDFVLLTQDDENTLEFIKKFKLEYKVNGDHGYSFIYNNLLVGLSSTNDLFCEGYNTDLVFYDIRRKQFIPFGIRYALEKRHIIIYGYHGYPKIEKRKHNRERLKTAKEFIKFMTNNNKRVRVVRKNKYYRRMLIGFLKHPSKIKKLFKR